MLKSAHGPSKGCCAMELSKYYNDILIVPCRDSRLRAIICQMAAKLMSAIDRGEISTSQLKGDV